jgi:hypothetical protein
MDNFEKRLHRTWLELLLTRNLQEAAALVVEADLTSLRGQWETYGVSVDITPSAQIYIATNPDLKEILEQTLKIVATGHFEDQNGNAINEIRIEFRVKLLDLDENWREVIKEKIVNSKDSNQGLISEKVFTRDGRKTLSYNELKFASQSEIRIAQEFERRKVLFFPLAVAVRNDGKNLYENHREVDFLVCQDGVWGILEVSYHPDRFEKDKEKITGLRSRAFFALNITRLRDASTSRELWPMNFCQC